MRSLAEHVSKLRWWYKRVSQTKLHRHILQGILMQLQTFSKQVNTIERDASKTRYSELRIMSEIQHKDRNKIVNTYHELMQKSS